MRTLKELARPDVPLLCSARHLAFRAGRDTNGGRITVQSTPSYEASWFCELADARPPDWSLMRVRSDDAATINAAVLARERERADMDRWSTTWSTAPSLPRAGRPGLFAPA